MMDLRFCVYVCMISVLFLVVESGYTPVGDEVVSGSVLLPASRRGRYLANIVRRQAVDGTGIKFNKDADRMNAEAKKKVDVLSDKLLPYIVAEEERRLMLTKRVFSAVRSGERGVTVIEVRNRPLLVARRGQLYRCRGNVSLAQEPDSSGRVVCANNEPLLPIDFDTCLYADGAKLYVLDNFDFFYCLKTTAMGPSLPHNNTHVLACHPQLRTPYNHTLAHCSVEQSGDVVVQFRYYPDRSFRYVSELDPEKEVCSSWNPCQLGLLFSLEKPEFSIPAFDIVDHKEEGDKAPEGRRARSVVPRFPGMALRSDDAPVSFQCPGCRFRRVLQDAPDGRSVSVPAANVKHSYDKMAKTATTQVIFDRLQPENFGDYYVVMVNEKGKEEKIKLLKLAQIHVSAETFSIHPNEPFDHKVQWTCKGCLLDRVFANGEEAKWLVKEPIAISIKVPSFENKHAGVYVAFFTMPDGRSVWKRIAVIENVKIEHSLEAEHVLEGSRYEGVVQFQGPCSVERLLCDGRMVPRSQYSLSSDEIRLRIPQVKEGAGAGVYQALFNCQERPVTKNIAHLEAKHLTK